MSTFFKSAFLFFFMNIKYSYAAINNKNQSPLEKKEVIVAIVDTGIDLLHSELKNNIWTNIGETGTDAFGHDKSNNHIDDDLNGFIDDVHGWNFILNNNQIKDENGHGTHVSGIIVEQFKFLKQKFSKNNIDLKLMILKYYSSKESSINTLEYSNQALKYALKMKANLINYSGGGLAPSFEEYKIIQDLEKNKILFVAAAGNNHFDTDIQKYFPAGYTLSNIISVAATDKNGTLQSFSNFGNNSVDIAAPGTKINSTLPGNKFGYLSGTSQATAYITALSSFLMLMDLKLKEKSKILVEIENLSSESKSLNGKTKNSKYFSLIY